MAHNGKLLEKIFSPTYSQIRTLIKNKITRGGIQYDGFKYHPRHPDFKDPPCEPSKLFLVTRIKPVWGTNPVERKVLQILNIDGLKSRQGHKAIVKNIPEVNSALWKIKHLVTIVPITCPQGLPKDGDYSGTYLHSNGRFDVSHKLKIPEDRIAATEKFNTSEKRMTGELLKKHLRNRWNDPYEGTIHERTDV